MTDSQSLWFIEVLCGRHSNELIFRSELAIIDRHLKAAGKPWKFYTSMAKLAHLWRDQSKDMFATWRRIHGDASAVRIALKMMPDCIASRWGSVDAVEARLEASGQALLLPVLQAVLQKPVVKAATEVETGVTSVVVLDDLSLEESKAHTQKMGRWSRDVLLSTQDKTLFIIISATRRAHCPNMHFTHYMQKTLPEDAYGERMADLMYGKARHIAGEFNEIVTDSGWWNALLADAPGDDISWLRLLMVTIVLHNAAAFHRRIVQPLEECAQQWVTYW